MTFDEILVTCGKSLAVWKIQELKLSMYHFLFRLYFQTKMERSCCVYVLVLISLSMIPQTIACKGKEPMSSIEKAKKFPQSEEQGT